MVYNLSFTASGNVSSSYDGNKYRAIPPNLQGIHFKTHSGYILRPSVDAWNHLVPNPDTHTYTHTHTQCLEILTKHNLEIRWCSGYFWMKFWYANFQISKWEDSDLHWVSIMKLSVSQRHEASVLGLLANTNLKLSESLRDQLKMTG